MPCFCAVDEPLVTFFAVFFLEEDRALMNLVKYSCLSGHICLCMSVSLFVFLCICLCISWFRVKSWNVKTTLLHES